MTTTSIKHRRLYLFIACASALTAATGVLDRWRLRTPRSNRNTFNSVDDELVRVQELPVRPSDLMTAQW